MSNYPRGALRSIYKAQISILERFSKFKVQAINEAKANLSVAVEDANKLDKELVIIKIDIPPAPYVSSEILQLEDPQAEPSSDDCTTSAMRPLGGASLC